MNQQFYKQLKNYGKVKTSEPMSKHTTFKIGGPARYFVSVDNTDNLVALLKLLDEQGIPYMILGGGSNMLVSDDGFDGVVIEVKARDIEIDGTEVKVDAGYPTVAVAQKTVQAGLTGFEWGVGVPGSIGGAVRGNAGAMGSEMKDNVSKIELYSDGEVYTLSNDECEFGYRTSTIKTGGGVALRVYLSLEPSEDQGGMKQALSYLQYRNTTQPQGYASTGCIFKNADMQIYKEQLLEHFDENDEKVQQFLTVGKISAGWLIEQVGMKGAKIGNAQVSDVHGNFVINLGDATAGDVLSLIEQIKTKVYTIYGIALEEEIQIV